PAGTGDLSARDFVGLGTAAARLRRDLLQLLDPVGRDRVRRARHRVHRLTAGGDARPRQVLRRVAEDDVALVPGHAEHVGDDAVDVEHRVRAEVTDARLDLDAAI